MNLDWKGSDEMEQTKLENFVVVKRNGKKVAFDGTKIALAIKKGFDSIRGLEEDETSKYTEQDIQKVYHSVIGRIVPLSKNSTRIKIETIQDLIEEELKQQNYEDVYRSFKEYRERRTRSREMFFDEKKTHQFLKSIEHLGLKSILEEDTKRTTSCNTPLFTMLQYGATVANAFAKSYLMKQKYAEAHESGEIYIHDLDFLAMGTTMSCQIDLTKLYKRGFDTLHGTVRSPKDISTYAYLAGIVIGETANDQHGGESIAAFDYDMAPGVLKTFKRFFKESLDDLLEFTDYQSFLSMDRITREIERMEHMDDSLEAFDQIVKGTNQGKRLFHLAYEHAFKRTKRATEQAMESLIYNLNRMRVRNGVEMPIVTLNFGTDCSVEGRMVSNSLLKAFDRGLGNGETADAPSLVFKVKEGINCTQNDPNYDLYELATMVSLHRGSPSFSFLDMSYHQTLGETENHEVAYFGDGSYLLFDVNDEDSGVTGRGILSITTLNLPRLGIKYGIALKERKFPDLKGFFQELEEKVDFIVEQLLERFEISCDKSSTNFPFLVGVGVWNDGELAKPTDRLRKLWKHGSLSIGMLGLAECLKALTGSHHGEKAESQALGLEIVGFIRRKLDAFSEEWKVNFTCMGISSNVLASTFMELDKAIYGSIKGVTDKDSYTNSFELPSSFKKWHERIKIEAPYYPLTNGGHQFVVRTKQPLTKDGWMKLLNELREAGIGYASLGPILSCCVEQVE